MINSIGIDVYLSNHSLDDARLKDICEKDAYRVMSMNLSYNNITAVGITYFSSVKWNRLAKLLLYNNQIGNRGCLYLSRASSINLTSLNLGKNGVGSEGLSHLMKSQWKLLQEIWFQQNRISYNGVISIVRANCKKINSIGLWENKLTIGELWKILFAQSMIKLVCLYNNNSSENQKQTMKKAFQDKLGDIRINL